MLKKINYLLKPNDYRIVHGTFFILGICFISLAGLSVLGFSLVFAEPPDNTESRPQDEKTSEVMIRFYFPVQFLVKNSVLLKNTFRIRIDGQKVFEKTFVDTTGGHSPGEAHMTIPKGKHSLDIEIVENGARKIVEINVQQNMGITAFYELNKNGGQVRLEQFPYDKIFYTE